VIFEPNNMLYFGYGMNTNLESMARRCPGAVSLGYATLPGYEFTFKVFADVIANDQKIVDGVLWEINSEHLKNLDALEGYPIMYDRAVMPIEYQGRTVYAWVYYMTTYSRWGAPSAGYVETLRDGYAAHNVPQTQIDIALEEHKNDNYFEYCYDLDMGPNWIKNI
jgi:gamma-glutamylcyclotransferase (GGCT)/AIG2-like uncharacterized protein YtfP